MDNSGPAFPSDAIPYVSQPDQDGYPMWEKTKHRNGLTKRELAAMFAMAGLLANPNKDYAPDGCAIDSLCYADALLAALKEETK